MGGYLWRLAIGIWIVLTNLRFSKTDSAQLSVPSNVRVGRFFSNGVEILWDYPFDNDVTLQEVNFLIQYKRANETNWIVRQIQNETKFIMTPVTKSAWYQARIKAERRNLASESPWTQVYLFSVPTDKNLITNISTPHDVVASLLSPTSVHLRWASLDQPLTADDDTYYLVDVEAKSDLTGQFERSRQVRVKSQSFVLDQLDAGTAYRFRVRTHSGYAQTDPTDWIVIRMPSEAETFSLSQLRVSYSDDTPGLVNLTWFVPEHIKDRIFGYVLWFSTSRDTDLWSQQYFPGSDPQATLYNLAPNTTYFLTIETQLTGGSKTESSVFQFRTPPVNPIKSVDVIYSKTLSTIRLQWTLKSFVDKNTISGYELFLSETHDAPENQWRRLASRETFYDMQNLKLGARYFVKFRILNRDGTANVIPTIYHFATMNDPSGMKEHSIVLTYQRVSPGKVRLQWEFPAQIERQAVSESLVLYTNEPNRPDVQWMKIMVPGARRQITLTGIMAQTPYYVKVLPRVQGSTMDIGGSGISDEPSVFFLNPAGSTDTNVTSEIMVANRISDQAPIDSGSGGGGGDFQALCLKRCRLSNLDPNILKSKRQSNLEQGCSSNEQCVVTNPDTDLITNISTPHKVTASLLSPASAHLRWASLDQPLTADDEAETFSLSQLRVSYSDDTPGLVNLTWFVPEHIKERIFGYVLWFSTSRDTDLWSQQYFPGSDPQATLYHLAPNTTYFLTIETQLTGGSKTESSVFQFRTPPVNPIKSVDVIYSKTLSTIRLQWTLKSFVDKNTISGYELFLSETHDAPENQWRRLASRETFYDMQNLKLGARYFVKFRILNRDGTANVIPTIYHFATMNDPSGMKEHSIVLTYQRVSPGKVQLQWEFPAQIERQAVTESLVLYTNEPNRPDVQWMKIMVPGARRQITLTGIMAQTPYYVKVLPRVQGSTMDMGGSGISDEPSVFFLNSAGSTDTNVTSEIMVANRISDQTPIDSGSGGGGGDFQALCLKRCRLSNLDPNILKSKRQSNLEQGCSSNEQCVVTNLDTGTGYCIPKTVVNAVRNNTST